MGVLERVEEQARVVERMPLSDAELGEISVARRLILTAGTSSAAAR